MHAGESQEDIQPRMQALYEAGIGGILDYGAVHTSCVHSSACYIKHGEFEHSIWPEHLIACMQLRRALC